MKFSLQITMSSEPEIEKKGIFRHRKNPKPSISIQSMAASANDKNKTNVSSGEIERQTKERAQRIPDSARNKKKEDKQSSATVPLSKNTTEDLGSPWTKMTVMKFECIFFSNI